MAIIPLPQFEADLAAMHADDRDVYEALKPPKTIVIRFGSMKLVGEYPYDGTDKPGCGSKIVVRTHRGTEIGEMLTSTCPNSGCSKSVSRKQMLEYVENSGGRDYPFFTDGRVMRIATVEDLNEQSRAEQQRNDMRLAARAVSERLGLPLKVVEIETMLGNERCIVHFASEVHADLRDFSHELSQVFKTRIDFHRVGARDEARLTADYERCGQYCCCKNFLKVLKPVSMKSAKTQKATLDPLKISGRCGRLMCCLRYEDETYDELSKRLPRRKTRVGTPEGDGLVIDGQILTQLVLVRLDVSNPDGTYKDVAIPVENLTPPISAAPPPPSTFQGGMPPRDRGGPGGPRGMRSGPGGGRPAPERAPAPTSSDRPRNSGTRGGPREGQREGPRNSGPPVSGGSPAGPGVDPTRRNDRVPGGRPPAPTTPTDGSNTPPPNIGDDAGIQGGDGLKRRRRRRRRKPGGPGTGPASNSNGPNGGNPPPDSSGGDSGGDFE